MSQAETTLSRFEKAGRAGEDAVLVTILTAMILLAASQIVMRNFFNFGFIWTDEMLRMLVLWIAVAGAVAASRTDKHINIAILDRFLPDRIKLGRKNCHPPVHGGCVRCRGLAQRAICSNVP